MEHGFKHIHSVSIYGDYIEWTFNTKDSRQLRHGKQHRSVDEECYLGLRLMLGAGKKQEAKLSFQEYLNGHKIYSH